MELLPLAFTSGWTSPTVLLLGLLGRFAGVEEIPTGLQRFDGGVTALASHLVKAGLRLAINTSPEPASNIGASLAGDVSVAGVTAFAVLNPVLAAAIVAVLLAAGIWLTVAVLGRVRRGWRAFRRWLEPA